MTSQFGPVECHHLVSFYRKQNKFDPLKTRLKICCRKKLPRLPGVQPALEHLLDLNFRPAAISGAAKRLTDRHLQFEILPQLVKVEHLEHLFERGLGYRIIFNMGGKVYNPEDPSTLPDVTLVVTDLLGDEDRGSIILPGRLLEKLVPHCSDFFGNISGCSTFEAAYTWDKHCLRRDGKVELEFFHFDKLLSPEQLKIYNKYASVFGEYLTLQDLEDVELCEKKHVFARAFELVLGLSHQIDQISKTEAQHQMLKNLSTRLKKLLRMIQSTVLEPSRLWAEEIPNFHNENILDYYADFEKASAAAAEVLDRVEQMFEGDGLNLHQLLDKPVSAFYEKIFSYFWENLSYMIENHIKQLDHHIKRSVVEFFAVVRRSNLSGVVADYLKESELMNLLGEEAIPVSSKIASSGQFEMRIHNNTVKLSLRGLVPEAGWAVYPLLGCIDGPSERSCEHSDSDSWRGFPIEPEPLVYGYNITPFRDNLVVISSSESVGNIRLIVDLDRLYSYRDWQQRSVPIEEVWKGSSTSINRPVVGPMFGGLGCFVHHVSSKALVLLNAHPSWTGNSTLISLHCVQLANLETKPKWVTAELTSRAASELRAGENVESVYHVPKLGQVFCALRSHDCGICQFHFFCLTYHSPSRLLEVVTDSISDSSAGCIISDSWEHGHWTEKKGRVFFFAVQSSPEIKLLVICYHKHQFLPLGRRAGVFPLGQKATPLPVLAGDRTVGTLFLKRSPISQSPYHFYSLSPDF